MNYIKKLHIEGFKKFDKIDINFNEDKNIIIGENESGKSTILEAINIVLNQKYKNSDKSFLKDLFNKNLITNFEKDPKISNLPKIIIELELDLDISNTHRIDFFGQDNLEKKEKYGITFKCEFNPEFSTDLSFLIADGKIPFEYYNLSWIAFSGNTYSMLKKPLNFIFIDTSKSDATSSFNYYNKALFSNTYDINTRMMARNNFRDELESIINNKLNLTDIDTKRRFGIDTKKVILESVINVIEDNIPLENKGSGMENLIKTEIALTKRDKSKIDVILIEEPENHLSYSNMQIMIDKIANENNSQIIITTHNDMIASKLELKNIMWIKENEITKFNKLTKETSLFFQKADTNNLLHFILSKKIILVEGPTEFMLIPKFYEQINLTSIEKDGISIISCNGISYKRYIEIANSLKKKVAILTDNDTNQSKIDKIENFNKENTNVKIFTDSDKNEWTWEVCLYHKNKNIFDNIIKVDNDSNYLIKNGINPETKVLGWMLNNKTECAYQILNDTENTYAIPDYIKKAIKWVKE